MGSHTNSGRALLHVFKGHENGLNYAMYSPDGEILVTASNDHTARLWNVRSGQLLHTLRTHKSPIHHVTFSPNGSTLITASSDQTARLWDTQSGRLLYVFKGHGYWVRHTAFSPDGNLMATASWDYTARLWPVFPDIESLIAHAEKVLPRRYLTCEERNQYFLDFVTRCAFVADENIQGENYQGDVQDEKAHGQGESQGRNRYQGGFRDGMKHGQGMYTWAEGETLAGEFVEDKYLHHGRLLEVPHAAAEWREMLSEVAGEEK